MCPLLHLGLSYLNDTGLLYIYTILEEYLYHYSSYITI